MAAAVPYSRPRCIDFPPKLSPSFIPARLHFHYVAEANGAGVVPVEQVLKKIFSGGYYTSETITTTHLELTTERRNNISNGQWAYV